MLMQSKRLSFNVCVGYFTGVELEGSFLKIDEHYSYYRTCTTPQPTPVLWLYSQVLLRSVWEFLTSCCSMSHSFSLTRRRPTCVDAASCLCCLTLASSDSLASVSAVGAAGQTYNHVGQTHTNVNVIHASSKVLLVTRSIEKRKDPFILCVCVKLQHCVHGCCVKRKEWV